MSGETGLRAAINSRRAAIRTRPKLDFFYRVGVALVGTAVIAAGIVLLPLPGPGWVIIFLGLGILASEFAWAGRLLVYARKRVGQWSGWVRRQSLIVRFALGLATLVIVAAALYGYDRWRGLPEWLPFIG